MMLGESGWLEIEAGAREEHTSHVNDVAGFLAGRESRVQ